MRKSVFALSIVASIVIAGAAIAQQATLGSQGSSWVQAIATALNKVNGDNGQPMQLVSTPNYFVVNGKALYYTDAVNMTPDQVVSFGQQTL